MSAPIVTPCRDCKTTIYLCLYDYDGSKRVECESCNQISFSAGTKKQAIRNWNNENKGNPQCR